MSQMFSVLLALSQFSDRIKSKQHRKFKTKQSKRSRSIPFVRESVFPERVRVP